MPSRLDRPTSAPRTRLSPKSGAASTRPTHHVPRVVHVKQRVIAYHALVPELARARDDVELPLERSGASVVRQDVTRDHLLTCLGVALLGRVPTPFTSIRTITTSFTTIGGDELVM